MPRAHIRQRQTAYLPESYAYLKYLSGFGWNVTASYEAADKNCDLEILFPGHFPFWNQPSVARKTVYDYTSLSTPPLSRLKNLTKALTERPPNGRIFLNRFVQSELPFPVSRPSIFRDMGIDPGFFSLQPGVAEYDLVYSGSIRGRVGLDVELNRLADAGLRIILIGDVDREFHSKLHQSIVLTGRVERDRLPELYSKARAGLTFTPDIFPYNRQTSTKTLEYLAAGLGVVANRVRWIEEFSETRKLDIFWLDDINDTSFTHTIKPQSDLVLDLSWDKVLHASGLHRFLESIL